MPKPHWTLHERNSRSVCETPIVDTRRLRYV
jgi:hypothetical protein